MFTPSAPTGGSTKSNVYAGDVPLIDTSAVPDVTVPISNVGGSPVMSTGRIAIRDPCPESAQCTDRSRFGP